MPFIQNQRKLLIALIILVVLSPIIFIFLTSRYGQFWKIGFKETGKQPLKQTVIETPPSSTTSSFDIKKEPLLCPSVESFCINGKDVIKNGNYEGMGANVSKESPVYAAFDGELTALTAKVATASASEDILIIYLDNKQKGLRAIYTLNGQPPLPKTVKTGDPIAKVGDKVNLFGVSLLFKLIKGDPISGENIKLSPANFIP